MSDQATPRTPTRPGANKYYYPPSPFTAPTLGDIDQRLNVIADAINNKADANTPTFLWIHLISPNGTVYAVQVADNGNLSTIQVAVRP